MCSEVIRPHPFLYVHLWYSLKFEGNEQAALIFIIVQILAVNVVSWYIVKSK